jgi:hypothetical protein
MPAMALVPYPDPATLSEGARRILAMEPQNIARMLAGSGPLFEPLMGFATAVCTENLIRVDEAMESPKLAE